jgi:hypothetical protein
MEPTASPDSGNRPQLAERVASAQRAYTTTIAAGLEQARRNYDQAQQAHSQEMQSLYAELIERTEQAYRAYSESLTAAYSAAPSYGQFMSSYREYLERLQELFAGGEATKLHKEAYDRYLARVTAQPGEVAESTAAFRRELEEVWKQQPLRAALASAQSRYVEQLQGLSEEARDRQTQALRELLQHLGDIWSQPEFATRTQGALSRLMAATRDVLAECHDTIEKSSARAIETLNADAT